MALWHSPMCIQAERKRLEIQRKGAGDVEKRSGRCREKEWEI